jgi:hypothetical protein
MATKCDLTNDRSVSTGEGESLARKFNIPFVEVSAKTALNVSDGFEKLVHEVHAKF